MKIRFYFFLVLLALSACTKPGTNSLEVVATGSSLQGGLVKSGNTLYSFNGQIVNGHDATTSKRIFSVPLGEYVLDMVKDSILDQAKVLTADGKIYLVDALGKAVFQRTLLDSVVKFDPTLSVFVKGYVYKIARDSNGEKQLTVNDWQKADEEKRVTQFYFPKLAMEYYLQKDQDHVDLISVDALGVENRVHLLNGLADLKFVGEDLKVYEKAPEFELWEVKTGADSLCKLNFIKANQVDFAYDANKNQAFKLGEGKFERIDFAGLEDAQSVRDLGNDEVLLRKRKYAQIVNIFADQSDGTLNFVKKEETNSLVYDHPLKAKFFQIKTAVLYADNTFKMDNELFASNIVDFDAHKDFLATLDNENKVNVYDKNFEIIRKFDALPDAKNVIFDKAGEIYGIAKNKKAAAQIYRKKIDADSTWELKATLPAGEEVENHSYELVSLGGEKRFLVSEGNKLSSVDEFGNVAQLSDNVKAWDYKAGELAFIDGYEEVKKGLSADWFKNIVPFLKSDYDFKDIFFDKDNMLRGVGLGANLKPYIFDITSQNQDMAIITELAKYDDNLALGFQFESPTAFYVVYRDELVKLAK